MTIAIQTRVKFNDTNQRLLKKFEQLEGNDYDDCYSNSSQIQWYESTIASLNNSFRIKEYSFNRNSNERN